MEQHAPGRFGEHGVALVAVSMAMLLLLAIGGALVLTTSSETMVAANFRAGNAAFYAADAVLERALSDLRGVPDWSTPLSGSERSPFVDGLPTGTRLLADGSAIDLDQIVNLANCQQTNPCSDSTLNAVTNDRPWGSNNPRWQLYAYGRLADAITPLSLDSPFYVIALVADDPLENDGNPSQDGESVGGAANPGRGAIIVRGEAFGPGGVHKVVEATIARIDTAELAGQTDSTPVLHVLSWREVR